MTGFGVCPLCTDRPASVTAVRHAAALGDDDLQSTLPITYRKGPKAKGRKVALTFGDLCDGCGDDFIRARDEADWTPEGQALLVSGERGELAVPLDWTAIAERAGVVLALRD